MEDYSTFEEAAEAISAALSTYKDNGPDHIHDSVVNYVKKQVTKGIKDKKGVFSLCELSKTPSVADFCVSFVYKLIQALIKNEKSVLNRGNFGYTRIYYDLSESIFSIDKLNTR